MERRPFLSSGNYPSGPTSLVGLVAPRSEYMHTATLAVQGSSIRGPVIASQGLCELIIRLENNRKWPRPLARTKWHVLSNHATFSESRAEKGAGGAPMKKSFENAKPSPRLAR